MIEEDQEGKTLIVTGRWSEAAEAALLRGEADGMWLNYARGYKEPDLEFLRDWPVRRLLIIDRTLRDLTPPYRLRSPRGASAR